MQTTMEQLSVLQAQKLEAEESLASQLAATKEQLMTAKANCERLKKELAIANDRLGKLGAMKRNGALCAIFFFSLLNVATLDATRLVLQEERRAKEEIIVNKQSIERKSKEFIESQQKKMEELNQAKVRDNKLRLLDCSANEAHQLIKFLSDNFFILKLFVLFIC